jgi:hypothetical protein
VIRQVLCKTISVARGKVSQRAIAISVMGLCLILNSGTLWAKESRKLHLDEYLMEATFRIEGNGARGTAFIIGKPAAKKPNKLRYVLITAAHVLENMAGDHAVLRLRQRTDAGEWEQRPITPRIRSGGHPLWIKHPDADIAVMYIGVPKEATVRVLPMELLATDEDLAKYEIRPGDELRCLGYPRGYQSNQAGFPVLRSGKIASYPLLPTRDTKTFLFDFEIFPGNSGGPVYIVETGARIHGGAMIMNTQFAYIMGLVSQQAIHVDEFRSGQYERVTRGQPLGLAVVVHASLIREAIELLPLP